MSEDLQKRIQAGASRSRSYQLKRCGTFMGLAENFVQNQHKLREDDETLRHKCSWESTSGFVYSRPVLCSGHPRLLRLRFTFTRLNGATCTTPPEESIRLYTTVNDQLLPFSGEHSGRWVGTRAAAATLLAA